jgi:hypothetical protein
MFNGCLMENLMMNSCISGCPICRQTQRGHNLVHPCATINRWRLCDDFASCGTGQHHILRYVHMLNQWPWACPSRFVRVAHGCTSFFKVLVRISILSTHCQRIPAGQWLVQSAYFLFTARGPSRPYCPWESLGQQPVIHSKHLGSNRRLSHKHL